MCDKRKESSFIEWSGRRRTKWWRRKMKKNSCWDWLIGLFCRRAFCIPTGGQHLRSYPSISLHHSRRRPQSPPICSSAQINQIGDNNSIICSGSASAPLDPQMNGLVGSKWSSKEWLPHRKVSVVLLNRRVVPAVGDWILPRWQCQLDRLRRVLNTYKMWSSAGCRIFSDNKMGDQEQYESLQQLNSLDCWDYSIELECLQGSQGRGLLLCIDAS